jgi:hypothetical protein
MAVTPKARSDFKEGQSDSRKGVIEQVIIDVSGNHPGTSAYFKGRNGEQLDGDKKSGDNKKK